MLVQNVICGYNAPSQSREMCILLLLMLAKLSLHISAQHEALFTCSEYSAHPFPDVLTLDTVKNADISNQHLNGFLDTAVMLTVGSVGS